MQRLEGRLAKNQRQARKFSKSAEQRLKGRQAKTQRQARRNYKAGKQRLIHRQAKTHWQGRKYAKAGKHLRTKVRKPSRTQVTKVIFNIFRIGSIPNLRRFVTYDELTFGITYGVLNLGPCLTYGKMFLNLGPCLTYGNMPSPTP